MSRSNSPSSKIQALETLLRERGLGRALPKQQRPDYPPLPTGMERLDARLGGGLPRGEISEAVGPSSSGRTALALSMLARATQAGEVAAYIDATDCLDPRSAEQAGVVLDRLLWVRCEARRRPRYQRLARRQVEVDQAWQAANLVASAGGFGVVVIDLGGVSQRRLAGWRRRPWIRLKQAIEHTATVLMVIAERHLAGAAAAAVLELSREKTEWDPLLGEVVIQAEPVRDKRRRGSRSQVA